MAFVRLCVPDSDLKVGFICVITDNHVLRRACEIG
jgi:hypothetical protein